MDEGSNDSHSPSNFPGLDRYRNPAFSSDEVEALIKLVEKYKVIILNKSTVSAINNAKEAAWINIAKIYNSQGFKHVRTPDCLKIKWDNLKRNAKKVSLNIMDPRYSEFSVVTDPVVALLCEAELITSVNEIPQGIAEELQNVMNIPKIVENPSKLSEDMERESDNPGNLEPGLKHRLLFIVKKGFQGDKIGNKSLYVSNVPFDTSVSFRRFGIMTSSRGYEEKYESPDGDDSEVRKMRSLNFSPKESSILLKCVKDEQNYVLSNKNTKYAIKLKRRAWARITEAFNKRSPVKRSTATLQTKFANIKRLVKKKKIKKFFPNKQHEKLVEEDIKEEPEFENNIILDIEQGNHNGDKSDISDDDPKEMPCESKIMHCSSSPDSMSNIFDSDSDQRKCRSLNFTPDDVTLLLKCVKEENKYVLSKANTAKALHLKNQAWLRITEAYNKMSSQERSTKKLKTKFSNLKKDIIIRPGQHYLRKRLKRKEMNKMDENDEVMKEEPAPECGSESEGECDAAEPLRPASCGPDPLRDVLSSDSGLGSSSFIGAYNFGANEVTKLQLELLKYQMENAKLERQRIQEAISAEAAARECAAVERSLRLRAARLHAAAAEQRLPAGHPALRYTRDEAPAQRYSEH